jgi:multisubunit Na+/H+ antiporter MnhG subunit
MRGWRRVIGTMLILLPAFVLVCGGLLLVLLESIYADVHWTSKYQVYVVISSAIVFLCACVTGGVWLRKSNG